MGEKSKEKLYKIFREQIKPRVHNEIKMLPEGSADLIFNLRPQHAQPHHDASPR
jgi:hypothetical protein